MLNRKVVALGRALIPGFVLDQINPFDRFVINAVREFSAKLEEIISLIYEFSGLISDHYLDHQGVIREPELFDLHSMR